MSMWYVSQVLYGGANWAVIDLNEENIERLRLAQEAWLAADAAAGALNPSVHVEDIGVYWLESLPETWQQPEGSDWEEVKHSPLEALAATADGKPAESLASILLPHEVRVRSAHTVVYGRNEIYFDSMVGGEEDTETVFLSDEILDILKGTTHDNK